MNPLRWIKHLLTTPQRLKDEFKKKISEAHLQIRMGEVSDAGLDQASETLKSIRNKTIKIISAGIVFLALWGCVTKSSHTEGDREVNDQQKKAGAVVVESNEAASAAIDAGDVAKAKTLLEQGAVAGAEIVKNAKQQEDVHGAAVNPAPTFSPENSDKARKKSADDHASGNWIAPTLTVLGTLAGIAATLAGMPWLAQAFPALTGKIGVMAKTGVATINTIRAKAEENGGSIDVGTVLEIAKDKNVQAGIDDLVKLHAHAHEDAMGHNLTSLSEIKEADAPAPVAASPVPPASVN